VREGLANSSVQSLHIETAPSGQRTVWIGTDGGGAFLLDADRREAAPEPLASRGYPALPNGSVYAILEDAARRIYVLTNRGVTRLSRAAEGKEAESFTTEHGLPLNQGNRGAGLVDYAGRVWIGTVGGAAAFDPRLETNDRVPKKLLLSAAPVDCEECAIFDRQRLPYGQRGIRFRYQLLSFFGEPLTTYRTELAGHETEPGEWGRANLREVSALPQGDYRFRVWGRDARGNVSGPAELAFSILPAPWQTSWARLAAAALLSALGFLLFRVRSLAHARRERELEAQVASRTRSLQRANALLVELSYVDALTAVPNRRRFDELFDQEWKRSGRTESPLGLVILDIDSFKRYNDHFGHQQGDEGLRQLATALADALPRSGDAIARYGGEEFAVLLPATDGAGAGLVADQLRERVEALAIPHAPDSGRRFLTVSCGAVAMVASPAGDPAELFRRADEAMYRAKRAGGNRTESG
jgi:diguanylate cyclase (GGDEF)-like protein